MSDATDIKAILERLEPAINAMRVDLAELNGKVSQLPTLRQIIATMLAIPGSLVAIYAFALGGS